jgi:hypothetical protein
LKKLQKDLSHSLTQTPAICDPELANPVTKNIVFPEVLLD